jgi:cytochrome c oxidase subunit IV
MHMMWERMALMCAILLPPLALGVLIGMMAIEGNTTFLIRSIVFGQEQQQSQCLEQNQECEHSEG